MLGIAPLFIIVILLYDYSWYNIKIRLDYENGSNNGSWGKYGFFRINRVATRPF